jgi:hypothetical protein
MLCGIIPRFPNDWRFSTGHFVDIMMGFGHDAEASSCHAFYGTQCSFVYRGIPECTSY